MSLAIVSHLVELHGGTVQAESAEDASVRNECSGEVLERVRAMQWLASAPV